MEQVTFPYEILIRLGRNGVAGAHYQNLTQIIAADGSTVVAEVPGTVSPLSLVQGDGYDLTDALGEATAVALSENAQLKLAIASLQEQVIYLQGQLAQLQPQPALASADPEPAPEPEPEPVAPSE